MKQASGTLLYRINNGIIEVLLVHPSGSYNKNSPWSIPKGELDPGEDAEAAARRETWEEAGVQAGSLEDVGTIQYTRTKKMVRAFIGEAPPDAAPYCASWEVDRAEFVSIDQARALLHPDQVPFLDRLLNKLA